MSNSKVPDNPLESALTMYLYNRGKALDEKNFKLVDKVDRDFQRFLITEADKRVEAVLDRLASQKETILEYVSPDHVNGIDAVRMSVVKAERQRLNKEGKNG